MSADGPAVGNHFDGLARTVVQSGSIGELHIHAPENPAKPAQVPLPTQFYTNNERQLQEITEAGQACAAGPDEIPEKPPAISVISGAPGSGKSEAAFQWVHAHRQDYPDGHFYVSLGRGTTQTGLESEALRGFLVAVGYAPETIPATLGERSAWFRSWSTGKRIALVIDDATTAAQVRALLPGLGGSVVLVTEAHPLPALKAREGARFVELDPLTDESARLLLARIADEDRDLSAEAEDVDELIWICGGSTIALCVAGSLLAQHPKRPVARLVRELSRESRRLKLLSRDADMSVISVLNTAFHRLDEWTQLAYTAFGRHAGAGPISVEALTAALAADDEAEVQDALDRLVQAKLVRETPDGRYIADMLIRDHARECAEQEPRATTIAERFDVFYVERAVAAGHALMPQRGWFERLWPNMSFDGHVPQAQEWMDAERANLRAVAARKFEERNAAACQLAVALWPLHERGKHLDDMDEVNEHAALVAKELGLSFARGIALVQRGFAFRHRGEFDKAAEQFHQAEALAKEHGPLDLEATAVESRGLVKREQGEISAAREILEQNLTLARELGESRRIALARMHLGSVAEPEQANVLLHAAISGFHALPEPDLYNVAKARLWSGRKLAEAGLFEDASIALHQSLEFMRDNKFQFDVAQIDCALGELAIAEGNPAVARQYFADALSLCWTYGYHEYASRVQARVDGTAANCD